MAIYGPSTMLYVKQNVLKISQNGKRNKETTIRKMLRITETTKGYKIND